MNIAAEFTSQSHIARMRSACSECALLDVCFPLDVSPPDQLRLRRAVRKIGPYSRGEYVFRRDDRFFAIYAIREGSLKRVFGDRSGRECVVSFHFAGEVFGFDAISTGRHASDCIALEPTSLCALPYRAVQEFACDYPDLYAEFIRLMSDEILRQPHLSPACGARERTAAFLLSMADRLGTTGVRADDVELKMKRQDIAFYLAMTPETLSRVLSDFETRQIIRTEGKRIYFLDRPRLDAMA